MATIIVVDAATGAATARALTDEEAAHREADRLAAEAARAAAEAATAERATVRALVVQTAQGAVGKSITALTAAEVRALVALLLYREGALTAAGIVRPLGEWLR